VMMVAAHPDDLEGAARCGLRTAFVPRPAEHGAAGAGAATGAQPPVADLAAADFIDLARRLGA
jgi:2-haloacid dehalogenase